MSSEQLWEPSRAFDQDGQTTGIVKVIEAMSLEVDQKVDAFARKREAMPSNLEAAKKAIASRARGEQLVMLSQFVFELAENEDYFIPLDLEDAGFITAENFETPVGSFDLRKDFIRKEVERGEKFGTNDCLSLLVPSNITDRDLRSIYFSRWNRDLMENLLLMDNNDFFVDYDENWDLVVRHATRLPNIEFSLYYDYDEKIPTRTIELSP